MYYVEVEMKDTTEINISASYIELLPKTVNLNFHLWQ